MSVHTNHDDDNHLVLLCMPTLVSPLLVRTKFETTCLHVYISSYSSALLGIYRL